MGSDIPLLLSNHDYYLLPFIQQREQCYVIISRAAWRGESLQWDLVIRVYLFLPPLFFSWRYINCCLVK